MESIREDLATASQTLPNPESPAIQRALVALNHELGNGETDLALAACRYEGQAAVICITDEGMHVAFTEPDIPGYYVTLHDLRGAIVRTIGGGLELQTRSKFVYRFEGLYASDSPSELAPVLARLAGRLTQIVGDTTEATSAPSGIGFIASPPPSLTRSSSPQERRPRDWSLLGGFVALAVMGWLFFFSHVTASQTTSPPCLDIGSSTACFDDFGSYGTEKYDCGTIVGTMQRSALNETGTLLESEIDKACGKALAKQGLPIGFGGVLLVGGWVLYRRG